MKQFLVLYGATPAGMEGFTKMSPKEQEEDMQAWGSWMENNANYLSDAGNPVEKNTRVEPNGVVLQESTNGVCGYSIVQAGDIAEAVEILQNSPHLSNGGTYIDVMEVVQIEM